jgi:tetratricopeptide (TPR) repeat protein
MKNIFKSLNNFFTSIIEEGYTAQDYYLKGKSMLVNNPEKSIILFSKAIEIDPFFANAYALRASSKLAIFDYSGAKEDSEKCLEIEPDNDWGLGFKRFAEIFISNKAQITENDVPNTHSPSP